MSALSELASILSAFSLDEAEVRKKQAAVQADLLSTSRHIREPNFRSIHAADLDILLDAYDARFLDGRVRRALGPDPLRMRVSRRMTRTGGTTSRFRNRATGAISHEIAVAASILFDAFSGQDHRPVSVAGVQCASRVEALQRIFEHELVHLMENLCFGGSDCSAVRFQGIAARLFLHRSHTHTLITRRERAAQAGIGVGAWVEFAHEGRRCRGRVQRVTKRATVLVPDPAGELFTDGNRYRTWYVPLAILTPVTQPGN